MTARVGLKCQIAGGGRTIVFNQVEGGLLVPDAQGNCWMVQDIGGWDSADVRTNSFDDVGRDGVFYSEVEHQSRTLTLQGGLCISPTEAARFAAMYALASALNITEANGPGTLSVWEDIERTVGVYKATAHTAQKGWPADFSGSVRGSLLWPLTFQAQLVAPDPWKLSASQVGPLTIPRFGGEGGEGLAVEPEGTYPSWPVYHITHGADSDLVMVGDVTAFALTDTYGAIPSELTIDALEQTCVDETGANAYQYLLTPTWVAFPPGVITTVAYYGSGTGTVIYYNAWI